MILGDLTDRLAPENLKRLKEIRSAYPDTPLEKLILSDIKQGLGVCLIEPSGDLTKTVLSCIPEKRLDDVILLDLMDSEYPFGLNIFECRNPKDINEVAKTASSPGCGRSG